MTSADVKESGIPSLHDKDLLLKWLENLPSQLQAQSTQEKLFGLLDEIKSTTKAQGNSCMEVCHFIEQCRDSKFANIKKCIFSEKLCLDLFCLFLSFNDKNQNRCMRRVLELVSSLMSCNLDRLELDSMKSKILHRSLSIISLRSSKPLLKPGLKSLEYFLGKGTISIQELIEVYGIIIQHKKTVLTSEWDTWSILWDSFIDEMFELMSINEISQTAGKFLVTIFQEMRKMTRNESNVEIQITWQNWTQKALQKRPNLLENIKNYLLPPLFNFDRSDSLEFVDDLSRKLLNYQTQSKRIDGQALLGLAALEVGKKMGLVEEPGKKYSSQVLKLLKLIFLENFKFLKTTKKLKKAIIFKDILVNPLLAHEDDIVRSISFSILVSSSSPLRPLSMTTIQTIKSKLYALYSNTEVKYRNEILNTTKQLIERLRGSSALLVKEISAINSQLRDGHTLDSTQEYQARDFLKQIQDLLQNQVLFIEWLFEYMIGELAPTASYQRHITSLKAINLWISSGIIKKTADVSKVRSSSNETTWPLTVNFFIPETIRLLMDLLMDPFEDVRTLSSEILKMSSRYNFMEKTIYLQIETEPEKIKLFSTSQQVISYCNLKIEHSDSNNPPKILEDFIEYIEDISNKTGRADYADGLAKSYELLSFLQSSKYDHVELINKLVDKLATKIVIAETNLTKAVQDAPLHGILTSLNVMWERMEVEPYLLNNSNLSVNWVQNFQQKSVEMCSQIWSAVGHILCNDSPEGYLPDDLEESNIVDTKDILSYSFRAIHESSNLLRTLMRKSQNFSNESARLPKDLFTKIGNLSFDMLSSLRHRGAFSTVSLTFASCCKLAPCYQSNNLSTWLESAFVCLRTQVSTTRRSAGIPSIVTAILSAMTEDEFKSTIEILLRTVKNEIYSASDQIQLPQVHALNCLKEIVKSVTTSAKIDAHVSECFEVVGKCLGSQVWAIRNSALILLRSLIDNLIGTNSKSEESETGWDGKTIKIQYEKYPALPRIIMKLLDHESDDLAHSVRQSHTVLPALSIIQRAGSPSENHEYLCHLVAKLLGSKTWHLREQAARTILLLHERGDELKMIRNLIENPGKILNQQHGSLITAKLILIERIDVFRHELCQLDDIFLMIQKSKYQTSNPFILNEYIELQNATLMLILAHPDLKEKDLRCNHVLQISKKSGILEHNSEDMASRLKSASLICLRGYVKQRMITSIILNDKLAIIKVLEEAICLGPDLLMTILEYILPVLKFNISEDNFCGILLALAKVLEKTDESNIISGILDIIPQIFEISGNIFQVKSEIIGYLMEKIQRVVIQKRLKISPQYLCSFYSFSGFIILHQLNRPAVSEAEKFMIIDNWVKGLKKATHVSQETNMRYSVALAIRKFYSHCPPKSEILNMINSNSELNFVIITLLLDDEYDIRRLIASTVSKIFNRSLCPLAALDAIIKFQITSLCHSDSFGWNCIHHLLVFDDLRSNYDPVDPGHVLRMSSNFDYSLFAVEEPNLYFDPSLTIDYFSNAFLELPFVLEHQIPEPKVGSEFSVLLKWASTGFVELQNLYPVKNQASGIILADKSNTSLPHVFITIKRIISCGKVAQAYWKKNSKLIDRLKISSVQGKRLVEIWEIQLGIIKKGLDIVFFQTDIHYSLRRFAKKNLCHDRLVETQL